MNSLHRGLDRRTSFLAITLISIVISVDRKYQMSNELLELYKLTSDELYTGRHTPESQYFRG